MWVPVAAESQDTADKAIEAEEASAATSGLCKRPHVGIRKQVSWRVGRSDGSCIARLLPKTPERTWRRTCGTDSVLEDSCLQKAIKFASSGGMVALARRKELQKRRTKRRDQSFNDGLEAGLACIGTA